MASTPWARLCCSFPPAGSWYPTELRAPVMDFTSTNPVCPLQATTEALPEYFQITESQNSRGWKEPLWVI